MNDYELSEIRRRDSHFVKDLPKPGPSDAMNPDIKDALHDRRQLLAEVDRLRAQVAAVERAADRIAVWGYKVDPVRIAQEIESALRGDRS